MEDHSESVDSCREYTIVRFKARHAEDVSTFFGRYCQRQTLVARLPFAASKKSHIGLIIEDVIEVRCSNMEEGNQLDLGRSKQDGIPTSYNRRLFKNRHQVTARNRLNVPSLYHRRSLHVIPQCTEMTLAPGVEEAGIIPSSEHARVP